VYVVRCSNAEPLVAKILSAQECDRCTVGVRARNGKYSVNGILSDIPSSGIFRVGGGDVVLGLDLLE
jgi:hypothetical protein